MQRPGAFGGLRHVALFAERFEASVQFYTEVLGMREEWRPDADNIYLSSGCDNLALHRAPEPIKKGRRQKLDHIGFVIDEEQAVDQWHDYLLAKGVTILTQPRTHRDGARSFYCEDPEGTMVQFIWHPPISGFTFNRS